MFLNVVNKCFPSLCLVAKPRPLLPTGRRSVHFFQISLQLAKRFAGKTHYKTEDKLRMAWPLPPVVVAQQDTKQARCPTTCV